MTRWIDTAEVARMIRARLKKRFPGTKFWVRSNRYAGGSSIDVYWDGSLLRSPNRDEVYKLVGSFHGATFDGMIDLKSYHDSNLDGESVHFGNDFLFLNNRKPFGA